MAQLRVAEPGFDAAKFSTRVAAFHVDALLFSIVFEAIHLFLLGLSPEGVSNLVMAFVFVIATFVVTVFPTKYFGQTLGKKLYGLKVMKAEHGGTEALSWGQAFQRELILKTISSIFLGFGFWRARKDPDGRGWHDSLTKTVVVTLDNASDRSAFSKLLESGISLLTVLVGVGLTLLAVAYTALPLPFFQEQMRSAGMDVQGMSGSLGGGLRIKKVSKEGLELHGVLINASLVKSWQEHAIILDSIRVDSGRFEVDSGFTWPAFAKSFLYALAQHSVNPGSLDPESELEIEPSAPPLKLQVGAIEVKDISLYLKNAVQSQLLALKLTQVSVDEGVVSAESYLSQVKGLRLQGERLEYSTGVLSIPKGQGDLSAELFPVLKKPVHFEIQGKLALDDAKKKLTSWKAEMFEGHGKASGSSEGIALSLEQLPLKDFFRTSLPLENVDLKMDGQGQSWVEWLMSSRPSYTLGVCGHKDVRLSVRAPVTFLQDIFTEKDAVENLFQFRTPSGQILSAETVPGFCGTGFAATGATTAAPPAGLGVAGPGPAVLPTDLGVPAFRAQVKAADQLFRTGHLPEARATIEKLDPTSASLAGEVKGAELGNFYSLKGWIELYSKDAVAALRDFKVAYKENPDLSVVEGMIRAEESLAKPDTAQIAAWTEIIKKAVKENPSAASRLTAKFRTRLGL